MIIFNRIVSGRKQIDSIIDNILQNNFAIHVIVSNALKLRNGWSDQAWLRNENKLKP